MSPERWLEIRSLLDAALQREPADRGAFLERSCRDESLLRDAQSLLMAVEDAGSFIEEPALPRPGAAGTATLTWGPPAPQSPPVGGPKRIGVYEVDRQIGQGGMGTVYLATRADDVFRKKVAVKVLKRGMDTDEVVRRFRSERQILANLAHVNIAQVLDGGSTSDGLPYLVMEYVEGTPINTFCDLHRLGLTQRIRLLHKVCGAVGVAHRNLVIHRDIKPANVLVTESGEPKLLDFGIAKLLSTEGFPETVVPTRPGSTFMTPEYASPEQVLGKAVTTASDVYSLGVLLYELLTGHRPYYFESRRPVDVRKAVCEAEPERPSSAVGKTVELQSGGVRRTVTPRDVSAARREDPRRLRHRLAGDLDNILLKALRKDPQRRYGSVEQLAEDLERYLTGRPVRARPDTFGYRTSKFVQRHRAMVAAVAVLLLLAGGFVTTLVVQHRQVVDERDRAELVSEVLTEVFALSDPVRSRGESVTVREVLDRGTEHIEDLLAERPEVRAEIYATLGRTYKNLGLYPEAREHLESAAAGLPRQGAALLRADVLDQLAQVLGLEGDFDRARDLGHEALALRRKVHGKTHPSVVASLMHLARLDDLAGRYRQAREGYQEALVLARQTDEAELLGMVLDRFGQLLVHTGDHDEAEGLLAEALEIFRRLGDEHPEVPSAMNNLSLAVAAHDPERAEELLRAALELQRGRYQEARPSLADSVENLAHLLHRRGRYEEAEPLYEEALELRHEVHGPRHPRIAGTLDKLASMRTTQGRLEEAEQLYRHALEMLLAMLGDAHAETAHTMTSLGQVLLHRGQLDEAEEMFTRSLDVTRRALGENHARVGIVLTSLAGVAKAKGDLDSAERQFGKAVEVLRKAHDAANLAGALHNLATLLRDAGRLDEARDRFREALAVSVDHLGDAHPEVAMIRCSLALVENRLGAHAEAESLARQAEAVFVDVLPVESPWTAAARRALGISLVGQSRYGEAEPILVEDFDRLREHRGLEGAATRRALSRLIELYVSWGRESEAAHYSGLLEDGA